MPYYEFECAKCGAEFEELVLSSKPEALAEVACPNCGQRKVKKKVSAIAANVKSGANPAPRASNCAPGGG